MKTFTIDDFDTSKQFHKAYNSTEGNFTYYIKVVQDNGSTITFTLIIDEDVCDDEIYAWEEYLNDTFNRSFSVSGSYTLELVITIKKTESDKFEFDGECDVDRIINLSYDICDTDLSISVDEKEEDEEDEDYDDTSDEEIESAAYEYINVDDYICNNYDADEYEDIYALNYISLNSK